MSIVVHTIPVPRHMTIEEAWNEIRLLGMLLPENVDNKCRWANIIEEVDDVR